MVPRPFPLAECGRTSSNARGRFRTAYGAAQSNIGHMGRRVGTTPSPHAGTQPKPSECGPPTTVLFLRLTVLLAAVDARINCLSSLTSLIDPFLPQYAVQL